MNLLVLGRILCPSYQAKSTKQRTILDHHGAIVKSKSKFDVKLLSIFFGPQQQQSISDACQFQTRALWYQKQRSTQRSYPPSWGNLSQGDYLPKINTLQSLLVRYIVQVHYIHFQLKYIFRLLFYYFLGPFYLM